MGRSEPGGEKERELQSRTKLLEKVFPIMSTLLRNKTISKTLGIWEWGCPKRGDAQNAVTPG